MLKYTTQMDAAKKGITTDEMAVVSEKEKIDIEKLKALISKGRIIIPCNKNHITLDPEGIGENLRTKINVNLGISKDCNNFDIELQKIYQAIELRAESIMDLSSFGETRNFRRKLLKISSAMVGTVPVYDTVVSYNKELPSITAKDFLNTIEEHAADGVDFMTIHAGITREIVAKFEKNKRLTNIVSRGGSLIYAWIKLTGNENPFYEFYDDVLKIFEKYDVAISLGDALRPGSIHDSTDALQIKELIVLGHLTKKAWGKNIQVMIEGPGHMPLNEIAANIVLQKKLCHGAPLYVLGPIVTDIAPGYDHITSAIGGAIAAANGADFLCYVTPAEHLRLPSIDDMKEGIIAAKIAAHAADIAKGVPNAKEWDYKMSSARRDLDWCKMFELALDSKKAVEYRKSSPPEEEKSCTMCGKMCAIRTMNKI